MKLWKELLEVFLNKCSEKSRKLQISKLLTGYELVASYTKSSIKIYQLVFYKQKIIHEKIKVYVLILF